jgi:hypothetical protein
VALVELRLVEQRYEAVRGARRCNGHRRCDEKRSRPPNGSRLAAPLRDRWDRRSRRSELQARNLSASDRFSSRSRDRRVATNASRVGSEEDA